VIHFFCEAYKEDLNTEQIVMDGGYCFFSVRFSIDTKTFSDLEINGIA